MIPSERNAKRQLIRMLFNIDPPADYPSILFVPEPFKRQLFSGTIYDNNGNIRPHMRTLQRLEEWKESGFITDAQFQALTSIVRKDHFSVFYELNALLYLGVLSLAAGIGWTIQTHFERLGDAAILLALTTLLAGSTYYCASRAIPFSAEQVDSPNAIFDYVLYLGCLIFAAELAYIEGRFGLLRDQWDYYVLFSSLLYFVLAYRFDNRFVLAFGLSTLAAWFGIKLSAFEVQFDDEMRLAFMIYGGFVAGSGVFLYKRGIKKHFLEAFLHVAANVLFIAAVSGVLDRNASSLYLAASLVFAAASLAGGIRFRRFAFIAYGTIYGYAAISTEILRRMDSSLSTVLAYFVFSGSIVIIAMILLARMDRNE
jgi:hypothetical protein